MATQAPQILKINPPNELVFRGPIMELNTTNLHLCNPTGERVAFIIKTTNPHHFTVKPNGGVIEPHGQEEVIITLISVNDIVTVERTKFLVVSMCVDETFDAKAVFIDINAALHRKDTKLMKSKLCCVFIDSEASSTDKRYVEQDHSTQLRHRSVKSMQSSDNS